MTHLKYKFLQKIFYVENENKMIHQISISQERRIRFMTIRLIIYQDDDTATFSLSFAKEVETSHISNILYHYTIISCF